MKIGFTVGEYFGNTNIIERFFDLFKNSPDGAVQINIEAIPDTTSDGSVDGAYDKIAAEIITTIKDTPDKQEDYMCHGEPHSYKIPDYDVISEKIKVILIINDQL